MPCYHPLKAWYAKGVNPSGKRSLVFSPANALNPDESLEVPCGQCVGCRLERSRQWAMRIVHENQLYEDSCFITLTFDNENLPEDLSIKKEHFQKFMKRLRKKYHPKLIRFFGCGEYGDQYLRPHYHAILFNHDFEDKQLWKIHNGQRYYTSEALTKLWPYGYNVIGNVTFESAAYVARYVMKKFTGQKQKVRQHYTRVDDSTGEIHHVEPEFVLMSRRPGIGKEWFDKYQTDAYPKDYVTLNGTKMKPPKYYDRLFEKVHPEKMEDIKKTRVENAEKKLGDNFGQRLKVREEIHKRKAEKLKRTEQ